MRQLEDARTVVQELGGTAAVARLTGRSSPKTVYNWVTKKQFPSWVHFEIQMALKQRDCVAADNLFLWRRRRKVVQRGED